MNPSARHTRSFLAKYASYAFFYLNQVRVVRVLQGLRVEKKFGDRRWYGGVVKERKAGRKKGEGSVFMIIYDDGDEEEVFYKVGLLWKSRSDCAY